jgi:ElaB/YqjD/DUF883 family membrane-anchored ribosome-binding protein
MSTPHPQGEPTAAQALAELEQLADEIQVKLHLAGMDAKDTWANKLEPRLHEARIHAREAKDASKKLVAEVATAFRDFSASLYSP